MTDQLTHGGPFSANGASANMPAAQPESEEGASHIEALQAEVDNENVRWANPPGWYGEPGGDEGTLRYWDGRQWVGPRLPAGVPAPPAGVTGVPPEPEYPPDCIVVTLGEDGDEVHVLPADRWRTKASSALRQGDFDGWAEMCLAGDDFEDVWLELNDGDGPTIADVEHMFEEFYEVSGQARGKSARSRLSSRRTRRR